MILAGAMAHGAVAYNQPMALQANGYDCGVAVLAGTRALIDTLPSVGGLSAETLDLSSVSIDRASVQSLLGGQPAPDDDGETDEESDLDAMAASVPRGEMRKGPWADALKAAHPGLSAADAAKIVGATKGEIAKRAAFKAVSGQDQARLDEIAAATPRQQGQSNGAWADALKAAHPDLSAADAAKIVGATKGEIANRAAFKAVSGQND